MLIIFILLLLTTTTTISCYHMLHHSTAAPTKKDFGKKIKLDGKFLRFGGKLIQDSSAMIDERRFVIVYYLADDTISVFETRKRNRYDVLVLLS